MQKCTFNNKRYLTSGINEAIPLEIQISLWNFIDDLVKKHNSADYLQVFTFNINKGMLNITHNQEEPPYTNVHHITLNDNYNNLDNVKIFVIDDITHSTMLLAEEY